MMTGSIGRFEAVRRIQFQNWSNGMTRKVKATTKKSLNTEIIEAPNQRNATLALLSSVNAASVIHAYQGNVMGKDTDMNGLIDGLRDSFVDCKAGDLSGLESMLIGQAKALQTIFTSLARRAQNQEYLKQYGSYLTLALKAQSQSRATIQAVIDLKFPRQVSFVKQANISHGAQQVNNGLPPVNDPGQSHAEEKAIQQNELLEDQSHGRTYLDAGATAKTGGRHSAVEAVGAVHRATKCRGQG